MFFHLTELEHHPIHFDVQYAAAELGLPAELRLTAPLTATGQAELLKNTDGEIRIRGTVRAELQGDCDRCLEPAPVIVDDAFDLFYRPAPKSGTQHPEIHLEEGEIDLSFYEGDGVALRDSLREFILLSLPMQLFCRPECKGLCPVCGVNRNLNACACAETRTDPRWEALKNL
jgi:uncharacterized protein